MEGNEWTPGRGSPGSGSRARWELLDIAFFAYLGGVVFLLLTFGVIGGAPVHAWRLIGYHLLLAAAGMGARALRSVWAHPVSRFLRWWYPALLFLFCFEAVGWMIHLIHPEYLDALLVAAEQAIFGVLWTPWLQRFATPVLTEIMYFCYTSYYFFIPGVGIPLYLRARGDLSGPAGAPFREYLFAISFTFWVCYLHFLFTPAGGPIYYAGYPAPVLHPPGGPITLLERWLFAHGGMIGGAFPSSHVAVAIVAAAYSVRFRIAPRFFVPVSVGLAVSTMYNGYHYGVDVVWATVVAAVVLRIVPGLFRRREATSRPAGG